MSGALEKQVAGVRAFARLEPEERAALAALPTADRNRLFYDGWKPTAVERIEARHSELVTVVALVHAARPDVVASVRFGEDSARVTFRDGDARTFEVAGFDRYGVADIDPADVALGAVEALASEES